MILIIYQIEEIIGFCVNNIRIKLKDVLSVYVIINFYLFPSLTYVTVFRKILSIILLGIDHNFWHLLSTIRGYILGITEFIFIRLFNHFTCFSFAFYQLVQRQS